jgi:hypothetical protein
VTAINASKQVSRYTLADLALRAAVGLERFSLGESFDSQAIAKFADALSNTSRADRLGEPTRYFAAGYHSPYMKLGRHAAGETTSVLAVQELLRAKADSIRAFLRNPQFTDVDELVSFCTDLHHELAQSQLAEIRFAKRPRSQSEAHRGPARLRTKAHSSTS